MKYLIIFSLLICMFFSHNCISIRLVILHIRNNRVVQQQHYRKLGATAIKRCFNYRLLAEIRKTVPGIVLHSLRHN